MNEQKINVCRALASIFSSNEEVSEQEAAFVGRTALDLGLDEGELKLVQQALGSNLDTKEILGSITDSDLRRFLFRRVVAATLIDEQLSSHEQKVFNAIVEIFKWDEGTVKEYISHMQKFIDAAHQRGIAVILDVVYGHASDLFAYSYLYDRLRYNENPFMGPFAKDYFGRSTDFNRDLTQDFFFTVNHHWLDVYHVDGFRYDCVPNYWDGPLGRGYASLVYETMLVGVAGAVTLDTVGPTAVAGGFAGTFMDAGLGQVTVDDGVFSAAVGVPAGESTWGGLKALYR